MTKIRINGYRLESTAKKLRITHLVTLNYLKINNCNIVGTREFAP